MHTPKPPRVLLPLLLIWFSLAISGSLGGHRLLRLNPVEAKGHGESDSTASHIPQQRKGAVPPRASLPSLRQKLSGKELRLRGGWSPELQGRGVSRLGSEDIVEHLQRLKCGEDVSSEQIIHLLTESARLTDDGDISGVRRGIQVLETASEFGVGLGDKKNGAYDACKAILKVAEREQLLKECTTMLALMESVNLEVPLSDHRSVVKAVSDRLENIPTTRVWGRMGIERHTTGVEQVQVQMPELNETETVVELPEHPKLVRGTLSNGFRYAILPNKQPLNRMCATLQVHAGSLEEEEQQQGIAHYLEHMLFAGTERYPSREAMKSVLANLGMSSTADQNAQTSFRATSYTASAPCGPAGADAAPASTAGDNVATVIDLFHQMAFHALLEEEAIDAERGVILSELQDRNTVGFRQTKAFYEQVYNETEIPERFPRGKEEQVERWNAADLRSFYDRMYCASNMDLFVVGDVDPQHVLQCINRTFGTEIAAPRACPDRHLQPLLWATKGDVKWVMPPLDRGPLCSWTERGAYWPEHSPVVVSHDFGEPAKDRFRTMRHELIPEVRISWFEKEPMAGRQSRAAFQDYITDCLIGAALGLRKSALIQSLGDPSFTGMGWSKGMRSNEECTLNSFFVSAQPDRWREALVLAVREVLKLTRFGMDEDELDSVKASVMAGYQQRAERVDTISSSLYMAKIVSCVESCTAFMDGVQEYEQAQEIIKNITLDQVNQKATELLQIVTEYPHNTTSGCFVTCPQNAPDDLTAEEVTALLRKAGENLERPAGTKLPKHLIPPEEIEDLVSTTQPEFVRWRSDGGGWNEGELRHGEAAGAGPTGEETERAREDVAGREGMGNESIVETVLSNGVKVNFLRTKHQPKQCNVLITALGSETIEQRDGGSASVQVGVSSWVHGGCGGHTSEVISKFCTRWNIHTEACYGAEGIALRASFTTGDGDADCMNKAFQLLHLLLRKPDFDPLAYQRSIKRVAIAYERMRKNLQASTRQHFEALLTDTPDLRLVQLSPKDVEGCTLEHSRGNVRGLLGADRLEVCVVGDFDVHEFKRLAKRYFGTLSPSEIARPANDKPSAVRFRKSSARENVTVQDDVEQCTVIMGFPTINAWGRGVDDPDSPTEQVAEGRTCLHLKLCLHLASRIISNRLFEQVREKMGLVYSISFRWQAFQVLQGGIALIQYMPKTEGAAETEQAVKDVIAKLLAEGFSEDEMVKVQRPVVARSRDATSTNGWWLDSLQFLQLGDTPLTARDIVDLPGQVERITKAEVLAAMQTHWKEGLTKLVTVCGSTVGMNQATAS